MFHVSSFVTVLLCRWPIRNLREAQKWEQSGSSASVDAEIEHAAAELFHCKLRWKCWRNCAKCNRMALFTSFLTFSGFFQDDRQTQNCENAALCIMRVMDQLCKMMGVVALLKVRRRSLFPHTEWCQWIWSAAEMTVNTRIYKSSMAARLRRKSQCVEAAHPPFDTIPWGLLVN